MLTLSSATARALVAISTVVAIDVSALACGGNSSGPGPTNNSSPPPRSVGHALVYHETLGQVLLLNAGLGGVDDSQRIGRPTRIWGWTGSAWNLLDSLGPPIRNLAGVAYDSRRNVVVLQGGTASESLNYGETWEWSQTAGWTKRSDGGPGVRSHTQMAYDRVRGRSVLFGGQNATGTEFPNDTWEWDGTTWTRAATSGPPSRVHHAMAFDAASNRIIVFGGVRPTVGDLGDTWAWDGTRWTELTGTSARTHAQIAAIPSTGKLAVVGGMTSSGGARTMLVLEQTGWRSVDVSGPEPRYLTAVAYDARRNVLVMYGGGEAAGTRLFDDTWEYDGTSWRRRP